MGYKIGSRVIYPAHGTAEIVGRSTREVDGEEIVYLDLVVPARGYGTSGDMKVSVPEGRAADLGVRDPISPDEADEVLAVLATTNVRVPANWSRRFKNHQEKLKSGDIYECAEVVRNLANREKSGTLSTAEKSMQTAAEHILVSELSVSWSIDTDAVMERINAALDTGEPEDAKD